MRRMRRMCIFTMVACVLSGLLGIGQNIFAGQEAGIAQVDYTPPLGLPLMGNFRDDYGARGVHDFLYARALVFQSPAGTKVALLSVDICMMDRENVALMRRYIASQSDLPGENVLIAATQRAGLPAAGTGSDSAIAPGFRSTRGQ